MSTPSPSPGQVAMCTRCGHELPTREIEGHYRGHAELDLLAKATAAVLAAGRRHLDVDEALDELERGTALLKGDLRVTLLCSDCPTRVFHSGASLERHTTSEHRRRPTPAERTPRAAA